MKDNQHIVRHTKESGFIKMIIFVVALIFIAGYFGLDVREWLDKPEVKEFFISTWESLKFITQNYIFNPVVRVWNWVATFIQNKA